MQHKVVDKKVGPETLLPSTERISVYFIAGCKKSNVPVGVSKAEGSSREKLKIFRDVHPRDLKQ